MSKPTNNELLTAVINVHDMIESALFLIAGESTDYDETIALLESLAELVNAYDGDSGDLWAIGECSHCSVGNLLIGAYWFCGDYHDGQTSDEYRLSCRIGEFYSPGMSSGPEPDSMESSAYEALQDKHPLTVNSDD